MADTVLTTEGRSNVPLRSIITDREAYSTSSTYGDIGAGNRITSGSEFWALEITVVGTSAYVYKYVNSHAPGETVDRVLVATVPDIDQMKFQFLAINPERLFLLMTAGKILNCYANYYDSNKAEWKVIGTVQTFTVGTDVMQSTPVAKGDRGCWVWLASGVALADGDRIAVCFNTDENIAADVEIPTKIFIEGMNTLVV